MRKTLLYVDVPAPSKAARAAPPDPFELVEALRQFRLRQAVDEQRASGASSVDEEYAAEALSEKDDFLEDEARAVEEEADADDDDGLPVASTSGTSQAERGQRDMPPVIILDDDSESEDDNAAGPSLPARRPGKARQLRRARQRIMSDDEVEIARLGPDDEIEKVLGRKAASGPHDMLYTVKLTDKRKVVVTSDDMHLYQDLLDDFQEQLEAGQAEEGVLMTDSSEDERISRGRVLAMRQRQRKGRTSINEQDYEARDEHEQDDAEQSGSDIDGQEEDDDDDDDDELMTSDASPVKKRSKGKGRATSLEPARRSVRDQAKKPINYTMVDPDDFDEEELDNDSGTGEEGSDVDSPPKPKVKRNPAQFVIRSGDSSSDQLDDSDEGEDERRAKARPTQLHIDECANCKASSARQLLPMYEKQRKRKRKDKLDGEWDEEHIRAFGAWLECDKCTNAYHFRCAGEAIKAPLRKMLVETFGSLKDPKPFLNINKTFRLPQCHDCTKPAALRCMICKSDEPRPVLVRSRATSRDDSVEVVASRTASKASSRAASNEKETTPLVSGPGVEGSSKDGDTVMEEATAKDSLEDRTKRQSASPLPPKEVMFRCKQCRRSAHYSCIDKNIYTWQNSYDWRCRNCVMWGRPDAVLAWRATGSQAEIVNASPSRSPTRRKSAPASLPDPKAPYADAEYLVKFQEQSFRHVEWVPHAWLFSAHKGRLTHFLTKGPIVDIAPEFGGTDHGYDEDDENGLNDFSLDPSPDAIETIPREWITPDRVLEVRYWSKSGGGDAIDSRNMKKLSDDPLESIDRISSIYIKWQGLPYESATWEEVFPSQTDPQYGAFLKAYATFLRFRSISIPRPTPIQMNALDKPRAQAGFRALDKQPDFITKGKLMDFQLEGVSWLYYNWWMKKGCILADEMGLGKTVQMISYISLLFKREGCLPFLVVVPNSTLQNWQREFDTWGPPDLRVVPYYGSKASRAIIEEYEMFTPGVVAEQKLRSHVVLTTYETLQKNPAIFKRVPRWESLVVDEAQRLKAGDTGLLWKALRLLRVAHTVLLTGTPVNNNLGELFNLLNFIDPDNFDNLEDLRQKYDVLTPALVEEVQSVAQPYFLRRTKEAVLNLPPLSEVIIPLSMSPLQKIVYKSVLEHNYEALAAIYDTSKAKTRAKMNRSKVTNVLMELRKTLCHPYLVREELEHESTLDAKALHRTLIEASSKLAFLKEFIPKLRAKGHRILLFSQFVIVLNIIQRFLEGEKIKHCRLDGSTGQVDRQTAIDAFNAPDSDLAVFILSTRAGGVGINLATADTVIIFDADFNPFQDLQAISRAHRIGQKKKVMCFKLMIKGTCEEKIIEAGKRKMVLEQLVMDSIEDRKSDEDEPNNVESLLLFGAKALFEESAEDASKNDIHFSSKDMDELIERTESTEEDAEATSEMEKKRTEANKAFSYARVWERTTMEQQEEADKTEVAAQRGFWTHMLDEQRRQKQDEEMARALQTGRGFRQRKQTNYVKTSYDDAIGADLPSTDKPGISSDSPDPDYHALSDGSDDDFEAPEGVDMQELKQLGLSARKKQKLANGLQGPNGVNLVYKPPELNENGMPVDLLPAHVRVLRSPTPPEVRERRMAMMSNLHKRAQVLKDDNFLRLMAAAAQAPTGEDQIKLCQRAIAMCKRLTPQVPPPPPVTGRPVPNGNPLGAAAMNVLMSSGSQIQQQQLNAQQSSMGHTGLNVQQYPNGPGSSTTNNNSQHMPRA